MFALISRILNLSGRYKSRIQAAFLCAFVESILSKMPIFMAFIVLAGFADNTLTGKTCLFVGLGLLAVVVVQTVVHYLSDRLQSAAGFMIFADKRMELGNHLRIPLIIAPKPSTSSPLTKISRKSAVQAHCLHTK